MKYYTSKRGQVEITLEKLGAQGHQRSHGRPVWLDLGDGDRMEQLFSYRIKAAVAPNEFRRLEREAAETRRIAYKGGRKVQRGRTTHSFAPQFHGVFST